MFVAGLLGAWRWAGAGAYPAWAFVAITAAITVFHWRNWPDPEDPKLSPEYRFTEQFRRDYPKLSPGSNLLFVNDEFPRATYDLLFNIRLMYHDRSINVFRMEAPRNQQPDPRYTMSYDHIFVNDSGYYLELDNRDPAESTRLRILKDYGVGREMQVSRRDHAAYLISGVRDGDNTDPTRWTAPHAALKFDLYPAPAVFTAKFWVPDFVAKSAARTLTISVNGKEIGALALSHDGMNEISFPVPADRITLNGFTIVSMDVTNPWKDTGGIEYGVLLLRAGFEYNPR